MELAFSESDLNLSEDFFSSFIVADWYAKQLSNSMLLDRGNVPEFAQGNRHEVGGAAAALRFGSHYFVGGKAIVFCQLHRRDVCDFLGLHPLDLAQYPS